MKSTHLLALLLLGAAPALHANPEIATVIGQEYGAATAERIVLLQSPASAAEPTQWTVYAQDPFRPGQLVRTRLALTNNSWAPQTDGAGQNLLNRVPSQPIPFSRVRYRSADARRIAEDNARLSKTNFVSVEYQLASNATTGAPEWGLALLDTQGQEVGFIVVSAETGAVLHQQWGNNYVDPKTPVPPPGSRGEKAADDVKRAARNAWQWTGDTGLEVGRFFKRLFKN